MLDYPISLKESTVCKLVTIAKIACPSMMTFFFQFLSQMINTYFIGHLNDPRKLAGAGLGDVIIAMLCLSVFMGMNGVLETFISQSIGGGNRHLCVTYLNRGRIIILLVFIPITIVLFKIDKVLVSLGQDPTTSFYARQYIVY